jgi:hypothetical protein
MLGGMARWHRITPVAGFFAATTVFSTLCVVLTVLALRGILVNGRTEAWPGTLVLVLGTTLVIRLNRMGTFVSDFGVRARSLSRTRTVPWDGVERFEIEDKTIWIVPKDGSPIRTGLVYRDAEPRGEKTGPVYSERRILAAFDQLRDAHRLRGRCGP